MGTPREIAFVISRGRGADASLASAARLLAQKSIKIGKKGCLFGSGELPKRHRNIRRLCVS
jgi:hypothetical protein